jgi:hypothetical protein
LISREEARSLVEAIIAETELPGGDAAIIVDNATIEKDWGWVFFYQSRQFLDTGDFSSRLLGNAPIIVNGRTGVAAHTGTAYPIEHYITEYERDQGLA